MSELIEFCQIKTDSKILYYDGSFDPFHVGHLSALVEAISIFKPEIVFVLAHDKNKYKPNLIDFQHRTQLIRLTISSLPYSIRRIIHVLDTPGQNHSIKEKLTNLSINVAVLMGTDSLRFFNFQRNPKISKHFVSIRNDESIDQSIIDKVVPIHPKIKDCSSTKIRELYSDFYLGKIDSVGYECLSKSMSFEANNYIQKNRLYLPTFEKLINNIEEHLIKIFPCQSIERLFSEPTPSQNYCFKLGKIFVKCFTKFTHQIESTNEINGIKLLNDLNISIKPLSSFVIQHEKLHHFSYFASVFMNATSKLSVLLISEQNNLGLLELFGQAGKHLAELHSTHTFPQVDQMALESHFTKLKNKLSHISKDQLNQFNQLKEKYSKNPGGHCLTHGDPNLSNFIVDPENGTIFLVDLDRLWHCHQMGIVGFPADDYYRFIASVYWFAGENNSSVKKFVEEFRDSYFKSLSQNVKITQESLNFYEFYWNLRDFGNNFGHNLTQK